MRYSGLWISVVMIQVCTHLCDIIFTTNEGTTRKPRVIGLSCTVAYFTEDVNPPFAKPPLKLTGGLNKQYAIGFLNRCFCL